MSLSVGIVGLPNAGKSTLFNALAQRRLAETAPRPFTTIDPHEAVVVVVDSHFIELSNLVKPEKTVPVSVTFIDIAGLIKGAHKGEGLGNQFLGKIREVDAIVHVVRAFSDPNITHSHASHKLGSEEQIIDDIEIVNLELEMGGISQKPTIYVLNVDENEVSPKTTKKLIAKIKTKFKSEVIAISAKLEEDLSDFGKNEKEEFMKELGIKSTGLKRLIKVAYSILGLISFYTIKGGKEAHAWSIKKGSTAFDAAGVVHTDFAKGFITSEVINVNELLSAKEWKKAKDKGIIRLEGRDYIIQDKDVIEFKVNV